MHEHIFDCYLERTVGRRRGEGRAVVVTSEEEGCLGDLKEEGVAGKVAGGDVSGAGFKGG